MDIVRREPTAQVLSKALDGLSLRQQSLANNLANVDTPNFKSNEVRFEQELQDALAGGVEGRRLALTDDRHFGSPGAGGVEEVAPRVVPDLRASLRHDGNNVDVDRDMALLAETQLSFSAATQLLNVKFHQLRQAIWEGKR